MEYSCAVYSGAPFHVDVVKTPRIWFRDKKKKKKKREQEEEWWSPVDVADILEKKERRKKVLARLR